MSGAVRIILNGILLTLSKVYSMVTWVRNRMYDCGILKEHSFDIPVIVVGNLAVGGTGKTPHAEYIVALLCDTYKVAVLSRGYKRSTKGFVLATPNSSPDVIGDEPYQMYRKFSGKIRLAVCEDRCKGIEELRKLYPEINLVVLDDAFQHRRLKPDISVVLMEFNRMPYDDHMLPYGRLRESIDGLRRASMVIVTKCPDTIKSLDYRIIKNELNLYPSQGLFFSRYQHGGLISVFPEASSYLPLLPSLQADDTILAITGIANPKPFTRYLRSFKAKVKAIKFADHHQFDRRDFDFIESKFKLLPGNRKIIVTTEKDAVRLASNPYFPHELKRYIYYSPITVSFLQFHNEDFVVYLNKCLKEVLINKKNNNKTIN